MTRAETLDKAKKCVCGQRETDYGSPEDNFLTIAKLWSAYKNVDFSAIDVAMMMALLKIARIRTGIATEDSFVDLAGYAACGAEIASTNRINNVDSQLADKEETDIEQIAREAIAEIYETITLLYQLYLTRNYEKEDI